MVPDYMYSEEEYEQHIRNMRDELVGQKIAEAMMALKAVNEQLTDIAYHYPDGQHHDWLRNASNVMGEIFVSSKTEFSVETKATAKSYGIESLLDIMRGRE